MRDLKRLERDVIQETKELEEKAFELFIKDCIKQDLEHIEKAERNLEGLKAKKESKDLDFYLVEFNKCSSTCNTYKEIYIDKLKE